MKAEHCSVDADAESHRKNGDDRKTRIAGKHPESVTDLLKEHVRSLRMVAFGCSVKSHASLNTGSAT